VKKFCGELTFEIRNDEFEYYKYTECWHSTEEMYISKEEKQRMDNYVSQWMMESMDCMFDAFKDKDNLLTGIDKCIGEFEEKRTLKWQAIFDKMQEKDKIQPEQKL